MVNGEKEKNVNDLINGGLTWGKLIAFAVMIVGSSFSTVLVRDNVIPPRPDPFTGTAAEILRLRIERQIEILKYQMPPKKTRERIRAMERWIKSQDPSYENPTHDWAVVNDHHNSDT